MSSDRRNRPPGSGRLWTDPRGTEEHQHWLTPRVRTQRTSPPVEPPAPEGPDPSEIRRRRRLAAAIFTALVLCGILVGASAHSIFGGDDNVKGSPLTVVEGAAPADARASTVR